MLPVVKTYKAVTAAYSAAIAELRPRMEETFKTIISREPVIKEAVKKNIESFPDRMRENLTNFIANSGVAVLTKDPKERERAIKEVLQTMPAMGGQAKILKGFGQKQLKRTLKGTKVEEIFPEEITAAPAPKGFPSDAAILRRKSVKRVK